MNLRDELGTTPSDEVVFWPQEDDVAVVHADRQRWLRGRFEGSALVGALMTDRRRSSRR